MTKEALKMALEAFKLIAAQDQGCGGNYTEAEAWRSAQSIALKNITAIKEALAQPKEQEPVACTECERLRDALKRANELAEHFERAWYLQGDEIERLEAQPEQKLVAISDCGEAGHADGACGNRECLPIFRRITTPPPCPTCEALARTVMLDQTSHDAQRKPLTDEEADGVALDVMGFAVLEKEQAETALMLIRATEAAHGIKETEK